MNGYQAIPVVPAHIVTVHFVFNTTKPVTYSIFLMSTSWSSDAIWRNASWLSERFWLLGYGLGTLSLKPTHRQLIIDETIENIQMELLRISTMMMMNYETIMTSYPVHLYAWYSPCFALASAYIDGIVVQYRPLLGSRCCRTIFGF